MNQTPDEMIEAIQAFKRDGEIGYKSSNGLTTYKTTDKPSWIFNMYDYYPIEKEELKMPELGSNWRSKHNKHFETMVLTRSLESGTIWVNNSEKGLTLEQFHNSWEPIK